MIDFPDKCDDPSGTVTYTVYDDAGRETRVYSGWDAATHQATEPIYVTRRDLAGNYTESLAYSWTGALPYDGVTGAPTGAEALTSEYATIESLSRTIMNDAGQTVAARQYFNLDGLTYSTALALGAEGVSSGGSKAATGGRNWAAGVKVS